MPAPKSSVAPAAVSPADPKKAIDADQANPGEMDREAGKRQDDSASGEAYKPPSSQDEREQKISWIEIEMVDQEDQPLPGVPYKITLPDGKTVAQGTLDEKGFARVDYIDPGSCKVTFPTLDQEAWEEI